MVIFNVNLLGNQIALLGGSKKSPFLNKLEGGKK